MNESAIHTKNEIHEVIDGLQPEQLAQLWEYVEELVREPVAPLYRVHEQAISTGVRDLAEQHNHYLYGVAKRDDG
jgi:hypothetical protein